MKKLILLFLVFASFQIFGQAPDSIQIKTDSIKVVVDSLQTKIDSLVVKKEEVIKSDTFKIWTKGGLIGADFSQANFTNWAAGGENSFAGIFKINLFANYKKNKSTWENSLDLAYGLLKSGTAPFRKNEDKIDLSSKYGRATSSEYWFYSVMVNFKSQFDNGYNYPDDSNVISHFLAPGYLLVALGMDYRTKDKSLSILISPITSKTTFVNDEGLANAGAYGVTPAVFDTVNGVYTMTKEGLLVKYELGGYIKFTFKKDIMKNVNLGTKLELFTNYLKDPQNIDVNWEVLLGMKINKFLTTTIATTLIYDHDIPVPVKRTINGVEVLGTGPRLQFKEVLSVGLAFKF